MKMLLIILTVFTVLMSVDAKPTLTVHNKTPWRIDLYHAPVEGDEWVHQMLEPEETAEILGCDPLKHKEIYAGPWGKFWRFVPQHLPLTLHNLASFLGVIKAETCSDTIMLTIEVSSALSSHIETGGIHGWKIKKYWKVAFSPYCYMVS
jgi:hypothetical protein